jgi:bifunctional non-homologous end joining protein LigD
VEEKVSVEVGGNRLQISNLDKVMYPETGFTKAQVIDYYSRVSSVMLPHLRGRPVTLKRYPDGVDGKFFFEKECPAFHPDWVDTARLPSHRGKRGSVNYCMVDNQASLVWLANLAALELHVLLSRFEDIPVPTYLVFDLDPGHPADIMDCAWTSLRLKELLQESGLKCFPKTSGKNGIHVCVPLNSKVAFEETKEFAHAAAQLLEKWYPKRVTSVMKKESRKGRVFIDWSQNDPHKTTVCVYSLRAVSGPRVSTPLTWEELESAYRDGQESELFFEAWEVLKRVEEKGDIFQPVASMQQDLPELQAGK